MGKHFRARVKINDRERARREKEAVGGRVGLRWRPLQLRELTPNEKSRPRCDEAGKTRFLKADPVDGKFLLLPASSATRDTVETLENARQFPNFLS